jgi:hypothetical protein
MEPHPTMAPQAMVIKMNHPLRKIRFLRNQALREARLHHHPQLHLMKIPKRKERRKEKPEPRKGN